MADKEFLKGLQSSIQKLNDTVAILEEQKTLDKNYMKGMHEMVDEVTNEKNTLSNRVSRLSQENEQLLGDCRKTDSILRQLNDSLAQHQQQVQQLQHMCEQQKVINTDLRESHAAEVARNDQTSAQLAGLQAKCNSHETKIKLYRTKLVDFSGKLKELRICKEVLLTTVREYSQAVSKWQGEILAVSNDFFEKNRNLKHENRVLEERLSTVSSGGCDQCAETMRKYEELVQQFEKMVEENLELGALVKDIRNQSETVTQTLPKEKDYSSKCHLTIESVCPDAEIEKERQELLYRSLLLQLDESLETVQSESINLQRLHLNERRLLQEKTEELDRMVIDLQSQLLTSVNQNRQYEEHIKQNATQIHNFKLQTEQTTTNEDQRQKEFEARSVKMVELEQEIKRLQCELITAHENARLINISLETERQDRISSESKANDLAKSLKAAQMAKDNELSDLAYQFSELQSQLQSTQKEHDALELSLSDERLASSQIQLRIEELESIFSAVNAQLLCSPSEEKKVLVNDTRNGFAKLVAQVNDMILQLTHGEEIQQDNNDLSKMDTLQALISKNAKNKLLETSTQISDLSAEVMTLRSSLETIQSNITLKEETIHSHTTTIEKQNQIILANDLKIDALQSEIESLQADIAQCQSSIESEKSAFDTLSEKHNETIKSSDAKQDQDALALAQLQETTKAQHLELAASKMCVDDLRAQLKAAKDSLALHESHELDHLQTKSNELHQTIESLKSEISDAHAKLATANEALLDRDTSNASLQKQINEKTKRGQELTEAVQQLRNDSSAQIRMLEQRLDSGNQALIDVQSELKEAEREAATAHAHFEQQLVEKEAIIKSKQMEMDDLLSEMRELNEALRNRGDIISKQEQKIIGLNAELTEKLAYVDRLAVEHEQLNERLRETENMPKIHGE